jgi:hypothetical protein
MADKRNCTTLFWVQPGNQVIGDQTFDSFAYSDKGKELPSYTISWRRNVSPLESKMTWLASIMTIMAFIIQFTGLRGLHSSVQVYQLAVVLIMSGVRALLRTRRLDSKDNLFHTEDQRLAVNDVSKHTLIETDFRGYELDRLAVEICSNVSRPIKRGPGPGLGDIDPHWTLNLQNTADEREKHSLFASEGFERIENTSLWKLKDPKEFGMCPPLPIWFHESTRISFLPSQVWCYRVRLGQLTSETLQKTLSQAWPDTMVKGRLEGRNAAQAISAVASIPELVSAYTREEQIYLELSCSFKRPETAVPSEGSLLIRLRHDPIQYNALQWSVHPAEIEATVSLTYYSCLRQYHALRSSSNFPAYPASIPIRRIIAVSAGYSKEALEKHVAQMMHLTGSEFPDARLVPLEYITVEEVHNSTGVNTLWKKSAQDRKIYTPLTGVGSVVHDVERICGWSMMPQNRKGPWMLATYRTTQPLMALCAQEIFTNMLRELPGSGAISFLRSVVINGSDGVGVQNLIVRRLIEVFEENHLGSRTDAVLCIIPMLYELYQAGCIRSDLPRMLENMDEVVSNGTLADAECEMLGWGTHNILFVHDEVQIWNFLVTIAWYLHSSDKSKLEGDVLPAFMTTLSNLGTAPSRIGCLAERLRIYLDRASPVILNRGKEYTDLQDRTVLDCIRDNDAYGVLILAYQIVSKSGVVEPGTVDELVRQNGWHWDTVIQEIAQRRDVFTICDEKGRNAFCRACLAEDLETAARIWTLKPGHYEKQTDRRGWKAFHHMVAENCTKMLTSLNSVKKSYDKEEDYKALFEALGADGVKLDMMIPFLQTEFGDIYDAALGRCKVYTGYMKEGKWINTGDSWVRGLRRVYDYQQRSKTPGLAATDTEP